jgi:hypothetical protein
LKRKGRKLKSIPWAANQKRIISEPWRDYCMTPAAAFNLKKSTAFWGEQGVGCRGHFWLTLYTTM